VTTLNMALLTEFLLQNSLLHGKDGFLSTIKCGVSGSKEQNSGSLLGFKFIIHHIFESLFCKCNFCMFGVHHYVMVSCILWWICVHKHPILMTIYCMRIEYYELLYSADKLYVVSRNLPCSIFSILSYLHQNTWHQVYQSQWFYFFM
jgi:hypothetical protein